MKSHIWCSIWMLLFLHFEFTAASLSGQQISIPQVEKMPNLPQPYHMRDWKKVATDLDSLIFDETLSGDHLPILSWYTVPQTGQKAFIIPTYVGWGRRETYESITCMGAVQGASVAGIDKSSQNGKNWVELCTNYFAGPRGINLYLNIPEEMTGHSFWYELFPSILFYRIYHAYPETPGMQKQFIQAADLWYDACVGMGGKTNPWTVPDFSHTAYDFEKAKPFDNDIWKEPGSSAAISWIEYMAFTKTGNHKYLTATRWGLDYLEETKQNPFYEILFPHGVYTAARMNAEQGTHYNIEKLLTWCFDGSNQRRWGQSLGRWGGYDCSGLVGSVSDNYMFAMNSFNMASSLVPLARYDDRFARSIGKWMLNAANSASLFYSAYLPDAHQTDSDWQRLYDPTSCIAYEGLRETRVIINRAESIQAISGKVKSGALKETMGTNRKYQVIEESLSEDGPVLECIWHLPIQPDMEHRLNMVAGCTGDENFEVSYAWQPEGPYVKLFVFDSHQDRHKSSQIHPHGPRLYLKVKDAGGNQKTKMPASFCLDDLWIHSVSSCSPYATGDAKEHGWASTNLGLYGSVYVGIFGGIIETTNVKGILKLNCLATDYFHAKAYPTWLYYNPYPDAKRIRIDVGDASKDLYDAVRNRFICKDLIGKTSFELAADSAIVAVLVPSGETVRHENNRFFVNDVVVDYSFPEN